MPHPSSFTIDIDMIESKVAEQILEDDIEVTLAGKTYSVARPTFATYLRVSELVATLPAADKKKDEVTTEDVLKVLSNASEYKAIPKILATLILGVSKPSRRTAIQKAVGRNKDEINALAEEITYTASIKEMVHALGTLINNMGLSDFFVLTTSLKEMNVAKPTAEKWTEDN